MGDMIGYLQNRISQTRQELEQIQQRITDAMQERDVLTADLQGYERTLAAEMRRNGVLAHGPASQEILPLNGPALANDDQSTSIAETARRLVRQKAANGVAPIELYDELVRSGLKIRKNYVYSLVQRLRDHGAVRHHNGRYYAVSETDRGGVETEKPTGIS